VENITDQESIVKKPVSKFVDKNPRGIYHGPLGDISRTFGGYITDLWGIYHGPLGDISRTMKKKIIIKSMCYGGIFCP
jgi:hypothetical protein